ncbi:hypothetical protein V5O48_009526 [Marasmius crinis-equi]|uniref:NAD(P)-binding protein n=1 Tax=Marasmius crinis-equi TaxID=585013 RepID=A0ABR3FAV9_9AGAR
MSRVWLITGTYHVLPRTSTGLGKTLVELLLKNGERVVATSRDSSVHESLTSTYSNQFLSQKVDLTKADEIKTAFDAAVKTFGRVDVVVNNAGYGLFGEIEGTPEEEARRNFDVQFWGPVNVSKEAARVFREVNPPGEGGRLFNISTVGGYRANPTLAYYSASKFALEGFTQCFLQEMTPSWNIKGCIIEPGGFQSEWRAGNANILPQHPAYTDPSNACAMFRTMHDHIPFLGDVKKMAQAIVTLADISMGKNGHTQKELPLRVPFGTESLFLVKEQARNTIREGEEWAWVSDSTNRDDMDGKQYVKDILLASGNFPDAQL